MKKFICMFLSTTVLSLTLMSNMVFAEEIKEGHLHKWEKEVIVEVNSEEEFLCYPKNPNYKYTFIISNPQQRRAVCYNCGRPNMSTVTYKEEANIYAKTCPTDGHWGNDIFTEWDNYTYERCTACNYQSEHWFSQTTYSAKCLNGDNPWDGGDWVVKYEYTQSAGYNLHQSLRWWTEYSYE